MFSKAEFFCLLPETIQETLLKLNTLIAPA
jgi:hypothetical protein